MYERLFNGALYFLVIFKLIADIIMLGIGVNIVIIRDGCCLLYLNVTFEIKSTVCGLHSMEIYLHLCMKWWDMDQVASSFI